MNAKLINDTIRMLQSHIDTDTAIKLDLNKRTFADIALLLKSYRIARNRKMAILGCCMLIEHAVQRHRNVPAANDNDALCRRVLDGDYLFGLYYKLIAEHEEWRLLTYLSPIQKLIPIAIIEQDNTSFIMNELHNRVATFLQEQCA